MLSMFLLTEHSYMECLTVTCLCLQESIFMLGTSSFRRKCIFARLLTENPRQCDDSRNIDLNVQPVISTNFVLFNRVINI